MKKGRIRVKKENKIKKQILGINLEGMKNVVQSKAFKDASKELGNSLKKLHKGMDIFN